MDNFKDCLEKNREIGYIVSLSNSVAYVAGLPSLKLGEMIITESGKKGICHGLKKELAEILMIDIKDLKIKESAARTGRRLEIPVGPGLLGRIIDPICQPIDGGGPIRGEKEYREVEKGAPSFIERIRVNELLETGVTIVDFLVPIGCGQRELIIGDAKTGKTAFLLQTIVSQAKKGLVGIYVGIGKKDTSIKWVEEYLKQQGVFSQTVIINTTPDDSPTLTYLAPFSGMSIAEYFRDKGKKVVIVLDDLTAHAKIYREISLLLKRPPGRDSYPGDIFHIHAALLERAGNINVKNRETSITALPVAETLENDITGYIQTNLMAITDGHVFFDVEEFRKGRKPAINAFLSVSRVGNQTRFPVERELAAWIRKKMMDYQESLEIAQFGAELPSETRITIELGKKLELLFNQGLETLIPRSLQLLLVSLLFSGFWQDKSLAQMKIEISKLLENYKRGLLPRLKLEEIKDLDHLQFLMKEVIPEVEKNI